jgi:hypothetical protein
VGPIFADGTSSLGGDYHHRHFFRALPIRFALLRLFLQFGFQTFSRSSESLDEGL